MDITLSFNDGRPDQTFSTATYMCLADRATFEKRFEISSLELAGAASRLAQLVSDQEDMSALAEASSRGEHFELREEHTAFFTWRCMRRSLGMEAAGTFEDFLDGLAEITLDEDLDAKDPTVKALRPA